MSKGKDELYQALGSYSVRKRNVIPRFTGILGITTGGNRTVEVPGRPGFVWIRLRNVDNEVIQAYNEEVSPVYDLPVIVERDKNHPTRYIVIGRDIERYQNWPSNSAYLPKHGQQHSFNNEDSGTGGDVVWVYSQQFIPFLVFPSGTYGSNNVLIDPSTYLFTGTFHYAGNTGTPNLLGYKPTGSNTARMILVYLDKETGNFPIATGSLTEFSATLTGTSQVVSYIPSPPENSIPLAGVRLVSGTSTIQWANIYDIRQYFS